MEPLRVGPPQGSSASTYLVAVAEQGREDVLQQRQDVLVGLEQAGQRLQPHHARVRALRDWGAQSRSSGPRTSHPAFRALQPSLIHSTFTHSLHPSLIHSVLHSFTPPFTHSLHLHSVLHSFTQPSLRPSLHPSLIHSVLNSILNSILHSFTPSLRPPPTPPPLGGGGGGSGLTVLDLLHDGGLEADLVGAVVQAVGLVQVLHLPV